MNDVEPGEEAKEKRGTSNMPGTGTRLENQPAGSRLASTTDHQYPRKVLLRQLAADVPFVSDSPATPYPQWLLPRQIRRSRREGTRGKAQKCNGDAAIPERTKWQTKLVGFTSGLGPTVNSTPQRKIPSKASTLGMTIGPIFTCTPINARCKVQ
ncbi:hypothetical protein N7532_001613 [Penicillium argentinense]|uniref:Uncharacterized protein n=1 Tax=Penicillium argentinense TaxID=1131581 RepID=A0A9W9G322_9EURO|nr:uncharacterized protein N7532_001613 [Penicillium argentinense]KAJ5111078.1 hypothetical protein N7532_001613 [Penicillium argentinense]